MKKNVLALLLVCVSVQAGTYDPVVKNQVDHYEAPLPAELVSYIPAVNYYSGPQRHFRRVAHVLVPDVRPGDILTVASNFGVTNDLDTLVELAAGLVLTPDATGTAGFENMVSLSSSEQPSSGKMMTRFVGFNVTPNPSPLFPHGGMHHATLPLNAIYRVPEGVSGNMYVAIVSYVAGIQYWPTSEYVTVEPWCAWLQVKRERF
jgi:hypothetical protein